MVDCRGEEPEVPYITVLLHDVNREKIDFEKLRQRINEDMNYFEKITTVCDGCWPRCVLFPLTPMGNPLVPEFSVGITNSEEIDVSKEAPATIKKIHEYYIKWNEWRATSSNSLCPYDVIIIYIPGNFFNNGGQESNTVGYAYDLGGAPYIILICEGAPAQVLSHEIGHVLNYSNRNNNKQDPDPDPENPNHNKNPGNLMYKEAGDVLTKEQFSKFCESTILRRPKNV
ncbi:hypothetical protein LIT25_21865 [Bacillus sp. F19]|nr:hypothetical protein LIT25_21865 [Bacillus sp. F19]